MMLRMLCVLAVTAGLFAATPAAASAWMACKGKGEVLDSAVQEDGTYVLKVRVREAVVTDGMAGKGDNCISGILPVIVEVAAPQDVKTGAVVPLAYRSYSGMGPGGPVSSDVWSLDVSEGAAKE